MKKLNYFAFAFVLATSSALAKPVTPFSAKTVAENFYKKNSQIELQSSTLVHTQLSDAGVPLFYVYNINSNDGFVMISADDATKPVLGYSTTSNFKLPTSVQSNLNFWLNKYATSINSVKIKGVVANVKATSEWAVYLNNTQLNNRTQGSGALTGTPVVAPLVKTTWNQSPYYNALCPGASVTGCVATTMAQIMKYWSYPAHGTGSSSYTQNPNANNYPSQSANYGITAYNWANMPLNVNSANSDVATLMYQAGVSVKMHYDPSGSGAQVLQAGAGINGACAQRSYTTYFGYDPSTIAGYSKDNFSDDASWLAVVEADLNIGRPVQYVGFDPNEGGHTWVCDGYDSNDYLHMNWGWAGSDDGYFQTDSLLTTNAGFNPSSGQQVLVGIIPLAKYAIDASIASIASPTGANCGNNFTPSITLKNFGSTTMTSCTINYQIDNGTVQILNWNGSLVNQQSAVLSLPNYTSAAGSHTLTCYSSNPNNSTDANTANDQSVTYYNVGTMAVLPVVEGFENTNTLPSWNMTHTSTGVDWAVTANAAATGANSIMIDNMSNVANAASTLQTSSSYDLSTFNSPTLSFKAAYQQKTSTSNDRLQIYTSSDCGGTWTSRKAIAAASLAALSGGASTTAYTPTAAQFTTYSVNINAVATSSTVMFKWVFTAGASVGNNIYLDDINIVDAAAAGIKTIEAQVGLTIYPNPSSSAVNVSFNLTEKQNVAVHVVDMLSRTVETIPATQYASGETILTIGNKTYQAGVYFINININGQQISKKIIME